MNINWNESLRLLLETQMKGTVHQLKRDLNVDIPSSCICEHWKGRTRKKITLLACIYLQTRLFFSSHCSDDAKVIASLSAAHTRVSVSVFVSEAALRQANSQHWQPSLFASDLDQAVWLSGRLKAQSQNRKVNVGVCDCNFVTINQKQWAFISFCCTNNSDMLCLFLCFFFLSLLRFLGIAPQNSNLVIKLWKYRDLTFGKYRE